MNKQYYLTEIGFDTSIESELDLIQIAHEHCSQYNDDRIKLLPIDTLQKALNYFEKYGFKVIKKLQEYPDTPFYYGKRLKAFIECGRDNINKKSAYYKVTCFCKRHEVLDITIFEVLDKQQHEVYKQACEHAKCYLNHCKY